MLKEIENIVKMFPNLLHYIVFTKIMVIQTSFKPPMFIPKMSEELLEITNHITQFIQLCQLDNEKIQNQLFETKNFFIFIIEIDDLTYLALIVKKTSETRERYITLRANLEYLDEKIQEIKKLKQDNTNTNSP